jgi:hypothetical protein
MLYDISRRYPRAYVHRHKLHVRHAPFTQVGQSEMVMLVEQVDKMTKKAEMEGDTGNDEDNSTQCTMSIPNPSGLNSMTYTLKKVFTQPPHITADNFFSSENLMDWLGRKGYGMTATCSRNLIPANLKPYMHAVKVDSSMQRCKAMRFENPIVAIQQCKEMDGNKAYTKTFVSFQSTSGTNIIGVNNLPSVQLYVGQKERGKKKDGTKRVYGIEQNEARETYLNHYYGLDNADHMIKNAGNRYITWKYWHSPVLHAQALGIVAAYDMYIECCEGNLDESWAMEVKKRMSFSSFRIRLSEQMLAYNPTMNWYPGDKTFRVNTQAPKGRRKSDEDRIELSPDGATLEHYKAAVKCERLCFTLEEIREHFLSVYPDKGNNAAVCEACGSKTIWRCGKCGKAMCTTRKRAWSGGTCIFKYHSYEFFGLSRSDKEEIEGKSVRTWTAPTNVVIAKNARKINRWKAQLEAEKN